MAGVCKKCLLREMAEADAKKIAAYRDAIKEKDRVAEAEYEARLAVCKSCDFLNAGTCGACGTAGGGQNRQMSIQKVEIKRTMKKGMVL